MGRPTQVVAEGLYFGEGPRWRDGRLWFSDFYDHAVKSVSPDGDLRTEFTIDDQPSGLGWMPDGAMLIVSMTRRQLLRRDLDGAISVHADLGDIATFHCNDMVVDEAGRAYVGNFGFDLDGEVEARGAASVFADHATAKLACVEPDGRVSFAAAGLHFPNGTVITPDGKTLIIAETFAAVLTAFDIGADGALSNRRVWAPTGARVPDGICLNADGAVWIANAGGPECVLIAEGGEVLEGIDVGQNCFACMLGGGDGRTLFMLTAGGSDGRHASAARTGRLLSARVDSPRAGRP